MKQKFLYSLLMFAAMSSVVFAGDCCAKVCNTPCSTSKNTWLPRAFSSYSTRDIMQEKSLFQVESKRDQWNGTLSFATEYMQNFGSKCGSCKNLGAMPFWSGTNMMTVGDNSGDYDLDAYQFGLGNLTKDANGKVIPGNIMLDPKIQQVGTDFMLYFTQSKEERGFFFKLHAPLGAIMIDPRLKEPTPATPDDALTFTQVTAAPASSTITYAWEAYPSPANRDQSVSDVFLGRGDKLLLTYGKVASCKQTAVKIGDVSASVGYNVVAGEKGFLGVAFKATCPTVTTPACEYMLEPLFGRAGAWGVGGEVMGHYKAWTNEAETRYLDVWLQGEVLHLMPGRKPSYRSFDLKANGKGSRYMLVQQYIKTYALDATDTVIEVTNPTGIQHAINITTLPVISKIAVEGSLALMLDFHCHNWNLALGGEFWGRSGECLAIDCCNAPQSKLNDYAVVGRQVSNYTIDGQGPLDPAPCYCEPLATISKSQNPVVLVGTVPTVVTPATLPEGIKDGRIATNRIPVSYEAALDIAGAAAAKAMTGKVTGQFGYTWSESAYTPSLSLFGGAEFTGNNNNAVQYWSAGIQGALNF